MHAALESQQISKGDMKVLQNMYTPHNIVVTVADTPVDSMT